MNVSAETMKLDCQSVEGPAASASIENDVGLRGIAAVLPPTRVIWRSCSAADCLFRIVRSWRNSVSRRSTFAMQSTMWSGWHWNPPGCAMARAEVEPAEIDVLIMASALSETHVQEP